MRNLVRFFEWFYAQSLKVYPPNFRSKFGDEMQMVFSNAMEKACKDDALKLLALFGREIRDWPRSVFQEYLHAWKGIPLNQNNLAWEPLNTKELLVGLAIFMIPIISPLLKLIFGNKPVVNYIGYIFTLTILIICFVIFILGFRNGFPRWSIPYLGVSITTIIMLHAVYPLWGVFATDIKRIINYSAKTLATRIQYSVLLNGFFWLVPFVILVLLILILRALPRTRVLARRIRQDWTLMSFMVYSALVFYLELIFEEYAYDEAWKIASRICLILGAWIYYKNADQRKRILALLTGATLFFGIAAVGQWVVLPLQTWGAFYGYDHWTYRRVMLSGTLTGWVSALFFMLLPTLLTRISRTKQPDPVSEATLPSA
ncbi:MAG TPA: hypothetical protein VLA72_09425 [Anaerolineales bacterium]|nr:hypothetical protein [Anaerolineales bacterium]